jgi:hypothetical protein
MFHFCTMVRHSVLFKINGAKFSIWVFPDDVDALAKWWVDMHTELEGIEATDLAANIGTMSVALMEDAISSVQELIISGIWMQQLWPCMY